jgi:hypothetical protein
MKLKTLFVLLGIIASTVTSSAQSKTTDALQKEHDDALSLFFYNNTLRMLNQKEDKAFDELIKNIEKMKLLMIKKEDDSFNATDYKKLVSDYKAESFEEIMTSRMEGKNFDIFIKGPDEKPKAMLVLINDESTLFVLDILGSIAFNRVTELYNTLDSSSDIGQKIKGFIGNDKTDEDYIRKEKKN